MNDIFTVSVNTTPTLNVDVCLCCFRYNCNRYNEDDAKAARDAQEVIKYASGFMGILNLHHPNCRTSWKHLHTSDCYDPNAGQKEQYSYLYTSC